MADVKQKLITVITVKDEATGPAQSIDKKVAKAARSITRNLIKAGDSMDIVAKGWPAFHKRIKNTGDKVTKEQARMYNRMVRNEKKFLAQKENLARREESQEKRADSRRRRRSKPARGDRSGVSSIVGAVSSTTKKRKRQQRTPRVVPFRAVRDITGAAHAAVARRKRRMVAQAEQINSIDDRYKQPLSGKRRRAKVLSFTKAGEQNFLPNMFVSKKEARQQAKAADISSRFDLSPVGKKAMAEARRAEARLASKQSKRNLKYAEPAFGLFDFDELHKQQLAQRKKILKPLFDVSSLRKEFLGKNRSRRATLNRNMLQGAGFFGGPPTGISKSLGGAEEFPEKFSAGAQVTSDVMANVQKRRSRVMAKRAEDDLYYRLFPDERKKPKVKKELTSEERIRRRALSITEGSLARDMVRGSVEQEAARKIAAIKRKSSVDKLVQASTAETEDQIVGRKIREGLRRQRIKSRVDEVLKPAKPPESEEQLIQRKVQETLKRRKIKARVDALTSQPKPIETEDQLVARKIQEGFKKRRIKSRVDAVLNPPKPVETEDQLVARKIQEGLTRRRIDSRINAVLNPTKSVAQKAAEMDAKKRERADVLAELGRIEEARNASQNLGTGFVGNMTRRAQGMFGPRVTSFIFGRQAARNVEIERRQRNGQAVFDAMNPLPPSGPPKGGGLLGGSAAKGLMKYGKFFALGFMAVVGKKVLDLGFDLGIIKPLQVMLSIATPFMQVFKNSFMPFFEILLAGVRNGLAPFADFMHALALNFLPKIVNALAPVNEFLSNVAINLANSLVTAFSGVSAQGNSISESFQLLLYAGREFVNKVGPPLMAAFKQILPAAIDFGTTLLKAFSELTAYAVTIFGPELHLLTRAMGNFISAGLRLASTLVIVGKVAAFVAMTAMKPLILAGSLLVSVFSEFANLYGNIARVFNYLDVTGSGVAAGFYSIGRAIAYVVTQLGKLITYVTSSGYSAVVGTGRGISSGLKAGGGFLSNIYQSIFGSSAPSQLPKSGQGTVNRSTFKSMRGPENGNQSPRKMASGGIVNRSLYANIGEAGREAVVPLNAKSIERFVTPSIRAGAFGGFDALAADVSDILTIMKEHAAKGTQSPQADYSPRGQASIRAAGINGTVTIG